MQIESIDIAKLKPYLKNNRKHSEQQIQRIAKSIQEYGFNQPLVVDENHEIIIGHGRLLAALALGHKTVPVKIVKDLTEEQKRAYRILDNKLQNDSEWDFENVESELEYLKAHDVDLEAWGLSEMMTPDFEPINESEQSRLDEKKQIECPECGHKFTP